MATGYAIVYNNRKRIDPRVGHCTADAEALLRVFQLEYPNLSKDAEIVEFDFPATPSFAFNGEESGVTQ